MKTLIVGAGALGGILACRLAAAGTPPALACRTTESVERVRSDGLHASGPDYDCRSCPAEVGRLANFADQRFELIVLATKAPEAVQIAPELIRLLSSDGALLPIQNGGVARILTDRLGDSVLGGLSNLAGTMLAPGKYQQTNRGHLLIAQRDGLSERVAEWLSRAVEIRTTGNFEGAVWSKLILNCSVTTLGAIAGMTMREYIQVPKARRLFERVYSECLAVAEASGVRLQRMLVDPLPFSMGFEAWLQDVLRWYGDLKPSMLQDFERDRPTEIDYINGFVAETGRHCGVPTPYNDAIVATVKAISTNRLRPSLALLEVGL